MNLKGKSFKKSAKFLTLLLTSIVIASVSAGVYYSLSMTSTITTATTDVWFVLGADNVTAGVSLSPQNTSATLTDLLAYPNATFTYIDPIRVRNNGSIPQDIRLRHISISGNDTEFDYVKFQIRNGTTETDAILRTLTYNCTGSGWTYPSNTTYVSIPNDTEWSVTIETKAVDDAAGASVTIEIAVDVK